MGCRRNERAAAVGHARSGGARDWCDLVELAAGTAAGDGNARSRAADCGAPVALIGGAGSAAISITQPKQQESMQAPPLLWFCAGEGAPAASL